MSMFVNDTKVLKPNDNKTESQIPLLVKIQTVEVEKLDFRSSVTKNKHVTFVDGTSRFIFVGCTSGSVYVFSRETLQFLLIIPFKGGKVCSVICTEDESDVAVGSLRGQVSLYRLLKARNASLHGNSTCGPLPVSVKHLYSVTHHSNNEITEMHWSPNGRYLFIGDNQGLISQVDVGSLEEFPRPPPSRVILQVQSRVLQLDCIFPFLAVNALSGVFLCDIENEDFTRIQAPNRRSLQATGLCLALTKDKSEDLLPVSLYVAPMNSTAILRYGIQGNLIQTVELANSYLCPNEINLFDPKKETSLYKTFDKQLQSLSDFRVSFGKLFTTEDGCLISASHHRIMFIDPVNSKIIHWNDDFRKMSTLKVLSNYLFIWETGKLHVVGMSNFQDYGEQLLNGKLFTVLENWIRHGLNVVGYAQELDENDHQTDNVGDGTKTENDEQTRTEIGEQTKTKNEEKTKTENGEQTKTEINEQIETENEDEAKHDARINGESKENGPHNSNAQLEENGGQDYSIEKENIKTRFSCYLKYPALIENDFSHFTLSKLPPFLKESMQKLYLEDEFDNIKNESDKAQRKDIMPPPNPIFMLAQNLTENLSSSQDFCSIHSHLAEFYSKNFVQLPHDVENTDEDSVIFKHSLFQSKMTLENLIQSTLTFLKQESLKKIKADLNLWEGFADMQISLKNLLIQLFSSGDTFYSENLKSVKNCATPANLKEKIEQPKKEFSGKKGKGHEEKQKKDNSVEIDEENHEKSNGESHGKSNKENHEKLNEENHEKPNEENHEKPNEENHEKSNEENQEKSNEENHKKPNEENQEKPNEENHEKPNEENHGKSSKENHGKSSKEIQEKSGEENAAIKIRRLSEKIVDKSRLIFINFGRQNTVKRWLTEFKTCSSEIQADTHLAEILLLVLPLTNIAFQEFSLEELLLLKTKLFSWLVLLLVGIENRNFPYGPKLKEFLTGKVKSNAINEVISKVYEDLKKIEENEDQKQENSAIFIHHFASLLHLKSGNKNSKSKILSSLVTNFPLKNLPDEDIKRILINLLRQNDMLTEMYKEACLTDGNSQILCQCGLPGFYGLPRLFMIPRTQRLIEETILEILMTRKMCSNDQQNKIKDSLENETKSENKFPLNSESAKKQQGKNHRDTKSRNKRQRKSKKKVVDEESVQVVEENPKKIAFKFAMERLLLEKYFDLVEMDNNEEAELRIEIILRSGECHLFQKFPFNFRRLSILMELYAKIFSKTNHNSSIRDHCLNCGANLKTFPTFRVISWDCLGLWILGDVTLSENERLIGVIKGCKELNVPGMFSLGFYRFLGESGQETFDEDSIGFESARRIKAKTDNRSVCAAFH